MVKGMKKVLKLAQIGKECVACGCCAAACPTKAIHIHQGTIAHVDSQTCVGCGKCAKECPAAVITIAERRSEYEKETLV